MEIKASYTNSRGDTIVFGHESGCHIVETELFSSSWDYSSASGRIGSISRDIHEASITLAFVTNDKSLIDEYFSILDYDARENTTGVLTVNGFSIDCCFIQSEPKLFVHDDVIVREMSVLIQSKFWRRNITQEFYPSTATTGGLDYPYGFSYDYSPSNTVQTVKVDGRHGADFVMVIYGAVSNPELLIGGHRYKVNVDIPAGGFLLVNSERKTITLVNASGIATNVFNKQDKTSYLFQKIPSGESVVSWVGSDFGFTLTIFEDRSEPKWI